MNIGIGVIIVTREWTTNLRALDTGMVEQGALRSEQWGEIGSSLFRAGRYFFFRKASFHQKGTFIPSWTTPKGSNSDWGCGKSHSSYKGRTLIFAVQHQRRVRHILCAVIMHYSLGYKIADAGQTDDLFDAWKDIFCDDSTHWGRSTSGSRMSDAIVIKIAVNGRRVFVARSQHHLSVSFYAPSRSKAQRAEANRHK